MTRSLLRFAMAWLAASLVPTIASAQDAAAPTPSADTLPGVAPKLVVIGFDDRAAGPDGDCPPGPPGDVPCVERVDWFLPPSSAAGVRDPGPLGLDARHAASGQLLFHALSDVAYRSSAADSPAAAALDESLWGWGATRLPSAESTWSVAAGYLRPLTSRGALKTSRIAVPAASSWLRSADAGARLCRNLDADAGASSTGTPLYLVCGDGFVGNFADRLNRPIEGDFFRHGQREGAKTGRSEGGELLISEYLFVSDRRGAPPWSNGMRYFDDGAGARLVERGPFRDLPLADGRTGRFVVPRALARADGQPFPGVRAETESWWREAISPTYLADLIDSGTARFVQEVGSRIVSFGTLEYNPTHIRTSMGLTAMLRPPPPAVPGASLGGATVALRNPGHRHARAIGSPPTNSDAAAPVAVGTGEALVGEIGVQVGRLPVELRWRWVGALMREGAIRTVVDAALASDIAADRCMACTPPMGVDDASAARAAKQRRLWSAVREAAKATGPEATAAPTPLETEVARAAAVADFDRRLAEFAAFLDEATARAVSQQLLESLLELLRINRSVLLFDDLVGEYESVLNSLDAWDPAALEEQGTAAWEQVLRRHGYQSQAQEVFGAPPNPLAVCAGRGEDDTQAMKLIKLHTYFEGAASEAPTRVTGKPAWELLHAHRAGLPFVAVDAPKWAEPAVAPVLLLPGGRAVYRAEWRIWSGWHLFWAVEAISVRVNDAETAPGEGLVLRSGALCEDTTLVARELEATLLRAALLRNFETTLPWNAPPGKLANPAEEELSQEEAAARVEAATKAAEEAAKKAEQALDAAKNGEISAFDGPAARVEVDVEGPAAELARLLRDRLAHDPRISCATRTFAGTARDDLDVDGRSERNGDCDDTDPEPNRTTRPALVVVTDLAELPSARGAQPPPRVATEPNRVDGRGDGPQALTPYLRKVFDGGLVGSTWALSTRRTPEDAGPTVAEVVPDARPLERRDRWGRHTTPEFTLDVFAGWTPVAVVRGGCDPAYEGPADFRCPKTVSGLTPGATDVRVDVTGNWILFGVQLLLTTWEPLYARTAFEIGADLDFFVPLPGTPVWGSSSVLGVRRFRQTTGVKFGIRTLIPPRLRTGTRGQPWSQATLGGAAGGWFPRTEIGIRLGFAGGDGWTGPEGGPNAEVWVGQAIRSSTGAKAASTPYRPKFRLAGFGRLDVLLPLGDEHLHPTRMRAVFALTFGVRGALSLGEKPSEPDLPDSGDFELPAKPTLAP